jgi:hypothetical protein
MMTARTHELVVTVAGVVITTFAVAVVKLTWGSGPAIFLSGVGTGAVITCIVLKNRELALRRAR